jgi:hypothetical protein
MTIDPTSTPIRTASSRARRGGGVIASLVAVAALLAGCSSSGATQANAQVDAAYAGAPAPNAAAGGAAKSTTADRSVIITGAMYITVKDPIAAADKAAGIVEGAGGRIDARSETTPVESNGGSATLKLRIPSNSLDAVVGHLRELGTVDQFKTDTNDVSTEVTDLDAKISTLRASTTRIETLLSNAKDIADIITIEKELDSRQAELQSLEAQQRGLKDQVSMSTIDLSLTTEPVVIVDNGPRNFWDGLVSGWNALWAFVAGVLVVVGVLLPWIALLGLIALAMVFSIRAGKARTTRRAGAAAVTPAPAKPSASRR